MVFRSLLTASTVQFSATYALVFIDATLENFTQLVAGVKPGHKIVLLDSTQDSIEQITQAIATHSQVASVHIVSHGSPGAIHLGDRTLSLENLNQYANQLQQWADFLAPDAEIMIYGCEVGKGDRGQNFIHRLSELTGAAIATVLTSMGVADTRVLVVFDERVQDRETLYQALLPGTILYTIKATEDALTVMTQLLTVTGAKRLAIVAHGEPGVIHIGTTPLNLEQLQAKAHLLQEWGVEEIALYSCEVGQNAGFISELEQLTGARVAATTSKVGSVAQGGSWQLETTASTSPMFAFLPSAVAQYQATLGNEFRVHTSTGFVNNDQSFSSITALSDGGFVVTWLSLGQDGSGWGIYGQRYNSSGATVGSEFRINTTTANEQIYSSVAALSDGGFVVTWSSNLQDGNSYGIYGQRYNASGAAVGTEFRINMTTANEQSYSSVTALSGGGFVVTWSSLGQDGSSWGIYGQRYNSIGATVGTEFLINTYTTNNQLYSSVTALSDGGFVVTWMSYGQDNSSSSYGIYGQRYNSSGTAVGSEFRINTYTPDDQSFSSVTALSDGGFVVTWSSVGQDGSGYGIYGQRYNSIGATVGTEFRINTYTTNNQLYSSVTALSDGGFVVTWTSDGQDGSGYGIYGQRYNSSGAAVGTEFLINQTTTGAQWNQTYVNGAYSVDQLANGNLAVTWHGNGPGDGNGVFARIFEPPVLDLNGNASGTDFSAVFTEDAGAINIIRTGNNGLTLTEADGQTIASATITITNRLDGTAESLAANTSGTGITAAYNVATGTLTLTGTAAASVYETVLRTITYNNTSQSPNTTARNISFVVTDISGAVSISRTSAVSVTAVNDVPTGTATASLVAGTEDTAYTITTASLLQGFSDVDGDTLSVTNLTATNGTLVNNNNGTYTFTPNANFNGTVNLSYNVVDGNGGITPATQSFSVTAVNDAPTGAATAVLANGTEDTTYTISAADLLTGFSDVDGDTLSVSSLTANNGSLVDNGNGTWTFTPDATFNGSVSLNYTVIDSHGGSINATQSFSIAAVNDAPTGAASAILAAGTEDTAYTITKAQLLEGFSDVDSANLSITDFTTSNGSFAENEDGSFTITPVANSNGAVTVTYKVSDGEFSVSGSNSFTLNAVNDAPTGAATGTLPAGTEDTAYSFTTTNLLSGFSDVDNDPLSVENVTVGGVVLTAENGIYTFTPDANFNGTVNVAYTVSDGNGGTFNATRTVDIAPANDAPFVTSPIAEQTAIESVPFTFTVPDSAFSDFDGDTLTYTADLLDNSPLPTWITFNPASRSFSGTPDDADLATLYIKVTATDPSGSSAYQVFQVAVNPTDDPTIINVPAQQVLDEDTSLIFSSATGNAITLTDVDAGDSELQVSLLGSAGFFYLGDTSGLSYVSEDGSSFRGTLTAINAALEGLSFYPNSDYSGTVNLQVMVSNPITLAASSNSFSILVNPVNDAPALTGLAATLAEGTEDTAYTITAASLLQGFTDTEGNPLSVANLVATNGSLISNGNGIYTFRPTANYNGVVNLTYDVIDDNGGVTSATQSFNLTAVADVSLVAGTTPTESGTPGTFVITLDSPAPAGGLTINYNLAGSTATTPADFSIIAGNNITGVSSSSFAIAAGATTATLQVTAVNDGIFDPNETVRLNLTSGSGYNLTYNSTTPFRAAPSVPVGGMANSVTLGDVNGDGKLDLATGAFGSNTVLIRLGDGAGNFSGTTNVSVGSSPLFNVLADINGDDKLDLLAANYGSSSVSVRLGDGTGNFTGTTEVPVGAGPFSIELGDINNDDKVDLITANEAAGTVSVRLGDGAGNFSGTTNISIAGNPRDVALADVNGDSNLDFLTANLSGNTVSVRLGDGTGNFSGTTQIPVGSRPYQLVLGDVNGDGELDLLTPSESTASISLRLGDGNGNFTGSTSISVGAAPRGIALEDVNGDGKLDLITANQSGSVSIRLGDGAGNFTGTTNVATTSVNYISLGDVNGDGQLDILASSENANSSIQVLLSNGGSAVLTIADAPNIAPSFTGNATLAAVPEDTTNPAGQSIASLFSGLFSDPNPNSSLSGVAVVGNDATTQGNWQYSTDGTNWYAIGSVSDGASALALSASTAVRFVPIVNYNSTPPALTVRALDNTYSAAFTSGSNRISVNTSSRGGATAISGNTNTINTSITAVNDAPIGSPTATLAGGTEDTAYTINKSDLLAGFSDIDGDTLFVSDITANGTALTADSNGNYVYIPPVNFNGSVTINYNVIDGNGGSVAATQTIAIAAANDAPALTGTQAILTAGTEDTAYEIVSSDLLAGFSDVDGDTLSVSELTATNGTLTNNGNGTYTFTPDTNFNGVVNLSYKVTDSQGGSVAATQSFTLTAVNDAPTGNATATLVAGTEDAAYTIAMSDLLAGFSDVDGDALSVSNLTATNGTLTNNNNGTYTFTPDANFNGFVNLSYNVVDGNGGSVAATQSFTVAAVNDGPTGTATASLVAGTEDTSYTITAADLLQGFSDVDGDTLSISELTVTNGSLTDNGNGTYTFTPNANFNGTVTLNYSVVDGNGGSVAATQSFSVAAVNDAPVLTVPAAQTANSNVGQAIPGISITDVDAGTGSLQVTLSLVNGSATLSSTNGLSFAIGDGNQDTYMVFSGSLSAINTALNNLSYRSNPGFSGDDSLTISVSDQGNTGSGGALTDSKVIAITNFNVINGTANADNLSATANPDRIFGNAGNDTVTSTLANAQQNDLFDGGTGVDVLVLSGGTAATTLALNVGAIANQLSGVPGLVVQNFETFNFSGFLGTLNATGSAGNDNITAGAGNDNLSGGDGNDTLNGGAGNNILDGGAGTNTLVGGTGDDVYIVSTATNTITEATGAGTDTVFASVTHTLAANVENLILTGATAINGTGNGLNNTLTGNSANNTLNGGAGADTLTGGLGDDSYVVDNVGDVINELPGEGLDSVSASVSYTLSANVENLTLTGTGAINGTGNALNNVLTGNTGNNQLDGGTGNDTLIGGAGNDTYVVDSLGDVITELAAQGTDTVNASISWTLGAELENLTLIGTDDINATGNGLNNTLRGNDGNNILNGAAGNDTLFGGLGSDTLLGGIGTDSLDGGIGADALAGGAGNDTYVVDDLGDVVTEALNEGTDLVQASISWTLGNNLENLTLIGNGAIDGTGNSLNNTLTGNSANNTLNGGIGSDILNGNGGADILIGGDGNDVLNLGLSDGAVDRVVYNLGNGSDTVNQFVRGLGGDLLQFNNIASIDVITSGSNTLFRIGDGVVGNSGFGNGTLLLTLNGVTGFTLANIADNIQQGNISTTFNFS